MPQRILRFPTAVDSAVTMLFPDGTTHDEPARGVHEIPAGVAVRVTVKEPECLRDLALFAPNDVQDLRVWLPAVNDVTLRSLSHLRGLRSLLVTNGRKVTDAGLQGLLPFAHLRSLTLLRASRITDQGLRTLSRLSTLRELKVTHARLTDDGLAALRDLPDLESLSLEGNWHVSGAGLEHVGALPRLRWLWLPGVRAGDDDIRHLSRLAQLQVIALHGTRTTEAALYHLPRNVGLTVASLGTPVSPARRRELAADLPHLDLGGRQTAFPPADPGAFDLLLERGLVLSTLAPAGAPVLVFFTGQHCRPCELMKPEVIAVAETHALRLRVVEVDVTQVPDAADALSVRSIPALVLFVGGRARLRLGVCARREILAELAGFLGVAVAPPAVPRSCPERHEVGRSAPRP